MLFSVIIPVHNRPMEIQELLESLSMQTYKNFEVIIIEDGSLFTCEDVLYDYKSLLDLSYHIVENMGQGFARNYGMKLAKGDYFVLFDSDCIIPPQYLELLSNALSSRELDAHGGPDDAGQDYSIFQKAINYSMTSLLTTGGIRGKLKDPGKYQARGYNMGLSKKAFERSGGFLDPNRGEDIELSIRLKKMGFKLELIEEAFVYHKRKNTWKSFFKQSFSFGENRINVGRFHPGAVKLVHILPSIFLMGWMFSITLFLFGNKFFLSGILIYLVWMVLVFLDATLQNKSVRVGILSVLTSFSQLSLYGAGLISEAIKKIFKG
ncbi:glycosyltransferase [Shivajiella indica]|uniref:Glycosyltransferase n=1 Tax=Shivajiella indica TaxID=872115 RepID=A0ABW5BCY1_9BACT